MASPPERRFSDLRIRTLSGLALAAAAFGLLWLGGWWTAAMFALGAGAAAWEWRAITAERGGAPGPLGWLAAAAVAAALLWQVERGFAEAAGLLALAALLSAAADLAGGRGRTALWGVAGIALVGVSSLALLALRLAEPYGFETAFWVVLVVVATDTGGYFAGRLLGGPLLWPSVSPKKTWTGLAGGIGLAFFGGGLFSWATTGTYFYEVCTVSAIAALLAQGGDLAESALKRRFGVKDAGRIIPGHGGALDRFDGLMAATLVAAGVTFWRGEAVFIW